MLMKNDPKPTIDADELASVQRRVEQHGKPEIGDPDLIAADDSGVSAIAQKLVASPDEQR
jgi:hypothetical protein